MKKRLLLFAAVLTASANFMFAENKTVQDSNGNTFSYDTMTDLDASSYTGETIYANTASFDILPAQYKITLKSDQRIQVSDCSLLYNVKLSALSATPGTIEQFTEHLHNDFIKYNVVVFENTISSEILDEDDDLIGYAKKEGEDYNRYIIACERAKVIDGSVIYKGSELLSGAYKGTIIRVDLDEVAICSDLYYARTSKKGNFMPILNVDGDYASGVTYLGSTVTYNPVGIIDGFQTYTVTGDGKVGYIHGVVDDGKVEEILSNTNYTYLNYDFTDVSILGSVATDIVDNRIAYFAKNTDATGQNIVVGSTCDSYVISDNGQEIYVNKAFSAEESKYKRTFSPETYGTIVLPFSVDNPSNVFVKQAVLTDYNADDNKMTFTSTTMIAPNTPYVFKVLSTVNGEALFYGLVNGTVKATAEAKSEKFNGTQFIGTFEGLPASDASAVYVIDLVGKIGTTTKALKPGRCYFTREVNNNARVADATIEIINEDGSIETIGVDEYDEKITAIDGVVNGKVVSVQYISLSSQISSEPFSGINLVKKTFEDGSVETSKVVF